MHDGGKQQPWVVVATFGYVWQADFAVETLREAGIPAHVDGGSHVGLFGAGYQGPSQSGAKVRVPWHREADARVVLDDYDEDDTHAGGPSPLTDSP